MPGLMPQVEDPAAILKKRHDLVVGKRRIGAWCEKHEFDPVKTGNAIACGHPDKAVPALKYILNTVGWEPVTHPPGFDGEPPILPACPQGKDSTAQEQRSNDGNQAYSHCLTLMDDGGQGMHKNQQPACTILALAVGMYFGLVFISKRSIYIFG
jgi:hypothetical protein